MSLVDRSQAFDWPDRRPESFRRGDTRSVSGRLRVDRTGTGLAWCRHRRLLGRRWGSCLRCRRFVRRCGRGHGWFRRFIGRSRADRRYRFGGWLWRFDSRIRGPKVAITLRTLPELLGGPRIFGSRVRQLHLGPAPLTTNADVWVVHGETDCSVPPQRFATRLLGGALRRAALLLDHRCPICSLVAPCQPGVAPRSRASRPFDVKCSHDSRRDPGRRCVVSYGGTSESAVADGPRG